MFQAGGDVNKIGGNEPLQKLDVKVILLIH